jgi:ABC-type uncharacterized transport system auxiliary subunit
MLKKLVLLSAIALSLTACLGGGSSEPTRYYTIAVENIQAPSSETFAGKSLLVRKFTIDQAYQRTNIVYRESAYDFMFYDLDLWASRPEHMITRVVSEYVEKSGMFQSVVSGNGSMPEYELSGHVNAIEEMDEGSSQSAHLALGFTFKNVKSNAMLWEGKCDKNRSTDSREPRVTAEAISKLLAECMEDALQSIAKISE